MCVRGNTLTIGCVNTYIIKSYTFNESVVILVVLCSFNVLPVRGLTILVKTFVRQPGDVVFTNVAVRPFNSQCIHVAVNLEKNKYLSSLNDPNNHYDHTVYIYSRNIPKL